MPSESSPKTTAAPDAAPRVPDPAALASVQALCDLATPYVTGRAVDDLFTAAMRENLAWHRARSPFYARLLESRGFDPAQLRSPADCARIPSIPANFFKRHEVLSVPRDAIVLHLTSSGTTGQKSQMFFDAWSIGCGRRMVDFVYEHRGWVSAEPCNYLLYAYEPLPGMKLGTTNTNTFLTKYAPVNRLVHALRSTGDGRHDFDVFGCIATLQQYEREGLPVRIFGFPAFLFFTLQRMRQLGVPPLRLPAGSLAMFGGGWKGYADQAIEKRALYAAIVEQLGIADDRVGESFGAVEHSIPYIECPRHELHEPIWSRVLVRDVRTLEPLPFGAPGFLSFVSPYILSVPAQSVMMGDLATLHPASECGCGIERPFFRVVGRAGVSKNKSCAVAAAELLRDR
jgi:phenylacetate-coenzyme A ligase PaaK-like adenylate-forming protein